MVLDGGLTATSSRLMSGIKLPVIGTACNDQKVNGGAEVLVRRPRDGAVDIIDDLSSHKRAAVREPKEKARATLRFRPPYGSDFDPIEKAFSKLKAMLRKVSKRTACGLWHLIGRPFDLFQHTECPNYFSSCGYDHG